MADTMDSVENAQDNPGVIAPPPLLYAGALVAGILLNLVFPVKFVPRWVGLIAGGLCILASNAFGPLAFREMRRAKTHVNPNRPVTSIVTSGPFRYTRNPIYVSFTLIYLGITLLANALWAMLLLPVVLIVMNFGVIEREERYLERKFGEQYMRYKQSVRRWI